MSSLRVTLPGGFTDLTNRICFTMAISKYKFIHNQQLASWALESISDCQLRALQSVYYSVDFSELAEIAPWYLCISAGFSAIGLFRCRTTHIDVTILNTDLSKKDSWLGSCAKAWHHVPFTVIARRLQRVKTQAWHICKILCRESHLEAFDTIKCIFRCQSLQFGGVKMTAGLLRLSRAWPFEVQLVQCLI